MIMPDPVILKDETLNIMIAGRDTVSSTLHILTNGVANSCVRGTTLDRIVVDLLRLPSRSTSSRAATLARRDSRELGDRSRSRD
jgi:hypothetical protein